MEYGGGQMILLAHFGVGLLTLLIMWFFVDKDKTSIKTGKYPSNNRNGCYGYKSTEEGKK